MRRRKVKFKVRSADPGGRAMPDKRAHRFGDTCGAPPCRFCAGAMAASSSMISAQNAFRICREGKRLLAFRIMLHDKPVTPRAVARGHAFTGPRSPQ